MLNALLKLFLIYAHPRTFGAFFREWVFKREGVYKILTKIRLAFIGDGLLEKVGHLSEKIRSLFI